MRNNDDCKAEFRIRLPLELADRIAKIAEKERRSNNLQYVYILENWFDLKNNLEERINNLETLLKNISNLEKT